MAGPTKASLEEKRRREGVVLDALLAAQKRDQEREQRSAVVNPRPNMAELPSDVVRGLLDVAQRGDEFLGENLDYYLGPTGIPDRLRLVTSLLDPGVYTTGYAAADMVDPRLTPQERDLASREVGLAVAMAPAMFAAGPAKGASRALNETPRLPTRRPAPSSVGDTAAAVYQLGDRLAAPKGYRGLTGKPSTVSIPNAGEFDARPISAIEQATIDYLQRRGMDTTPLTAYPKQDPTRARLIGSAYDLMAHDPQNPAVKRAYDAMIQETLDQYNALKNSGIDFRFLQPGMDDPYALSPAMGYQDLVENGRLWVFPTDFGFGSSAAFDPSTNPLLARVGRIGDKPDAVANDAFRAVHDAFGHFGPGNPFFRAPGEERAWLEHSRMYSPEARGAMTSETRGQNSWLNFGPYAEQNRNALGADTVFADQKTGLLDPWAYDVYGMPNEEQRAILEENIRRWAR